MNALATNEPTIIDAYTVEEEAEYRALVERLSQEVPIVGSAGFDYSRITGLPDAKTGKAIVLHLACTGWSIARIAATLGISTILASRYLGDAINDAAPLQDLETLRNWELHKLDVEEAACWKQFERSCDDAVTVKEREGGEGGSSETVRKGQSGNPAYMKVLLDIAKRRAALTGMDKPVKREVDKTERVLKITQVVVKTREEAEAARAAGLLT